MAKYSPTRILQLLRQIEHAETNNSRGEAFEDLCCYLLGKVRGVRIGRRDALNYPGSQEMDIICWVDCGSSPLSFIPWILVVEAKCYTDPVSSKEVGAFVDKLRRRRVEYGILVAMNGISGELVNGTHAWDIIRRALWDGIRVIVLTGDDIRSVQTTEAFVTLIQDKLMDLTVSA